MVDPLIKPSDRIFIAGANGMAGKAISKALFRSGYINQLTPSRKDLDLRNNSDVHNWFNKYHPNVVIIAAAKVGGIWANSNYPADFLLDNLKIEINIIENSHRVHIRRLLFLGSSCIYPKFAKQPIREESLLTGELEASNEWYAIAKIAGIKLASSLRLQHKFDAISLMPTNLYGPGDNYHPMNSHVLPAFIHRFHEAKQKNSPQVKCWGTGTPLREFLYVEDLGKACVFALENWNPSDSKAPKDANGKPLEIMNVGTGLEISIQALANKIAHYIGYKGDIYWDSSKPDGTPRKRLEVSRLTQLGWKAHIPLDKGIPLAYKDYLESFSKGRLRT